MPFVIEKPRDLNQLRLKHGNGFKKSLLTLEAIRNPFPWYILGCIDLAIIDVCESLRRTGLARTWNGCAAYGYRNVAGREESHEESRSMGHYLAMYRNLSHPDAELLHNFLEKHACEPAGVLASPREDVVSEWWRFAYVGGGNFTDHAGAKKFWDDFRAFLDGIARKIPSYDSIP